MASGVRARTPGTMTVLDPGRPESPDSARPPSSGRRSITKSFSLEMRRSSLEALKSSDREEGERRTNSAGSSGRRSALEVLDSPCEIGAGETRPGSGGRRPYTPNKQVSLKVARKNPEINGILLPSPKRESSPKQPNRTWETTCPVPADTGASGRIDRGREQLDGEGEEMRQGLERLELEEGRRRECRDTSQGKSNREIPIQPGGDPSQNAPGEAGVPQAPPAGPEEEEEEEEEETDDSDDDEDDDEDDDDDESDEEIKAPFELLGEFLESVMKEEYETAQKLCQMILIYEPENPEALQFKPLIEERLQQEAEAEEESSSSEGSTDDDDDDDDDDESTSETSSSEEEEDEEENAEKKSTETEAGSEKKADNSQPAASSSKYPPTFLTN